MVENNLAVPEKLYTVLYFLLPCPHNFISVSHKEIIGHGQVIQNDQEYRELTQNFINFLTEHSLLHNWLNITALNIPCTMRFQSTHAASKIYQNNNNNLMTSSSEM